MLLYSLAYQNLRRRLEAVPESFKDQISIQGSPWQTLDLVKILHCRIFRPKLLHRQFHLFSTVLAIKIQQKSENGEIYTFGKNFTLSPAVTELTNFTSDACKANPHFTQKAHYAAKSLFTLSLYFQYIGGLK